MQIKLTGWNKGFLVVRACQLIVSQTPLGLREAKQLCDNLLDGQPQTITLDSPEQAADLANALRKLHVTVELEGEAS